ncbi:MAG: DUF6273 domain-containing protein, partial [Treponema sp.]|nr:DUF6273 domain-containing protein [Treponema sp.]
TNVTAPLTVNAVYTSALRYYTVYFYNGSTLLQTVENVPYGGSATYTGATPVNPDDASLGFEGWSPSPTNITGNTTCYAQFESPVRGTITDTWAQIIAACSDGTYATKYHVGDTKEIKLGSEGTVCMQIVAFDADTRSDGNGTAHITWISEQLLKTSKRMNPSRAGSSGAYTEGTGSIGGWEKSEMRTYMKETIKPLIPAEVRAAILEVTKTSYAYNTEGTAYQQTTQDDVWLPSTRDLAYSDKKETSGPMYSEMFPDLASHKKYKVGSTSATYWWLRSAGGSGNFCYVKSDSGDWSTDSATISYGVALGFCT